MHVNLEMSSVAIRARGGRPLFEGLNLRIEREHVALVGRNGVGKSTLLAVLAGDNVVATIADPKIMNVPIATRNATATGCDYHSNVAEDQKMADALKTVFHSKLGW